MPDQTVPNQRHLPLMVSATLYHPESARALVYARGADEVDVSFGGATGTIALVGQRTTVRQLLTDALAQLDAIEATGG